jgi:hypothetical protein
MAYPPEKMADPPGKMAYSPQKEADSPRNEAYPNISMHCIRFSIGLCANMRHFGADTPLFQANMPHIGAISLHLRADLRRFGPDGPHPLLNLSFFY